MTVLPAIRTSLASITLTYVVLAPASAQTRSTRDTATA